MNMKLPKDTKDPVKQKESAVITLIPSGSDHLFYYEGAYQLPIENNCFSFVEGNYSSKTTHGQALQDFMVVIKPTRDCNYKNTIAILDEMTINQVIRYALVDVSPEESDLVDKLELNK